MKYMLGKSKRGGYNLHAVYEEPSRSWTTARRPLLQALCETIKGENIELQTAQPRFSTVATSR